MRVRKDGILESQNVNVFDSSLTVFDHGATSSIGTTAIQVTTPSISASDGVLVKSSNTNTETIYVGNSDVTNGSTDATDGFEIGPGESVIIPVDNANKVYVLAGSGSSSRVSWVVI